MIVKIMHSFSNYFGPFMGDKLIDILWLAGYVKTQ